LRGQEERKRRFAERRDPRPMIGVPFADDPWLPQMGVLNEVLGKSDAPIPPTRDIDGVVTQALKIAIPNLHPFSSANPEDKNDALSSPEQWVLKRMNEMECAEMIEQHIDFVDENDRSVQLPTNFVRHYLQRYDDALPTVVAIATLPIVLADGELLAPEGLDRARGIIFAIPKELRALIPNDCSKAAVKRAMAILYDEWLCDVATDYTGKCILIAAALSIIERSLLPDRPTFFVTAGRRGNGKTTALIMLIMAATGLWPAAAAWSTNEEERRKALLSYFLFGVPYILWDNIERGTQISCPHIEKSCTAAFYSDRKLGVSEAIRTAASVVHLFTGNNIGPRGDLASRSLMVRLQVDRTDPENRTFKHPDPVSWTKDHRAEILAALYTILLGNPQLREPPDAPAKTRFKMWWRLIGSGIEHAAALMGEQIDFKTLFLRQEEDDQESASLADALEALAMEMPGEFDASEVVECINRSGRARGRALREFLYPEAPPNHIATSVSVGTLLKSHVDEPVKGRKGTLILRSRWNRAKKRLYRVEIAS
jgi:hypothetical protein